MVIGEVGVQVCARLAFASMAAAVFVAGPACAQDFVMKFATQTINDVQHEFIKFYKAELEKESNNRIRVDIYPASQLGGAQRQSEGLRLGTIEAATGLALVLGGEVLRDPAMRYPRTPHRLGRVAAAPDETRHTGRDHSADAHDVTVV